MPQFEIEVGGNIAPITKSLQDLKSRIKEITFELGSTKDPVAIVNLNKELKETENEVKRIKNLGPIVPPSAANGLNQATVATTNFGRVLQDLPFGFVAISNNLNPLLESFQRLRAETGSGKAAIQALGSSLIGAGGLGLALSAVTAIFTFASAGFGAWSRGLGSSGAAAKKAASETEELGKTLNNVAEDVGKSASRVTTLVNALTSGTLNTAQRKKALDELKQQNQEYFGSLKDEKGVIEGLQVAYDGYLQRLNSIATAKALEAQLTKLFDKKLSLQLSIDPNFKASTSGDVQRQIGDYKKQLAKLGGPLTAAERADNSGAIFLNENLKKRADLELRINKLKSARVFDLADTDKEIEAIDRQIAGLVELQKANENFQISGSDTKAKASTDELKKRLEALERLKKATQDVNALVGIQESIFDLQVKIAIRDKGKDHISDKELQQQIQGFQKELNAAFLNQALSLELSPKVTFSPVTLAEIPAVITDRISKATGKEKITITLHDVRVKFLGEKATKIIENTEAINKQLSQEINDSITNLKIDLASTLGESLGEAFSTAIQGGDLTEGLRKAASAMLGVLGSTLQQIGKYVISAAIKIQILKQTLEKWAIANPALAILAGVGLIAAGSALKNATFSGPKFAQGGIVTGPTIGLVGEAGKEAIIPLNRLPDMIGNRGGNTVILNSTLGIKGRELVALITQETKRFNRIN